MKSNLYGLKEIKFNIVLFSLLLFISRMALPGLIYLFVPIFILSLVLFINDILDFSISKFITFQKYIWQFIIVGFFVCIGFFITFKILVLPIKEAINFIIILTFFIQFYLLLQSFRAFMFSFIKYLIYLSVGIAIIGLFHFFIFFNINSTNGSSLVSDNNFYALFSVIGIIAISYNCILVNKNNYALNNIFLFILFLNILFSFSRRGIFVLALFIIILTILLVIHIVRKSYYLFFKNTRFFWIFSIFSLFIFISFILFPPELKKRTCDITGIQYSKLLSFSNAILYRYSTIFTNKLAYSDIKEKYFNLTFDPNNPDTWGTGEYKKVFPLKGMNVEVVPSDAHGYMLDSTCLSSTWNGNAYSTTLIGIDSVELGDIINCSVFCYVSSNFNGNWVRLSTEGATTGYNVSLYDLSKKGTWQKLSVTTRCKRGIAPAYLFFTKYGVKDFLDLKGHVIFAYPLYNKVNFDPKNPLTWGVQNSTIIENIPNAQDIGIPIDAKGYLMDHTCNAAIWNGNSYSYTLIGNDSVELGDSIYASVFCYVSHDFNGTWVQLSSEGTTTGNRISLYDLSRKGTWQKLSLKTKCRKGTAPAYLYLSKYGVTDFSSLKGHVIFAYPQYQIIDHANFSSLDKDLKINSLSFVNVNFNWLKRILVNNSYINNDTINLDQILATYKNKELSESRLERWYFAWYLFKNEYRWYEKIFGGGFKYLEKFGQKFFPDEERLDYPHNPIISSFLYSGIIGGLFYIYFLILTFWYYWKYRKHHMVFFIMYLVTFFFVFFSSDSHFDTPIFAFLSLIPFITRYVVKEKVDKNLVEKKPQ